jgi:hypothetical protein
VLQAMYSSGEDYRKDDAVTKVTNLLFARAYLGRVKMLGSEFLLRKVMLLFGVEVCFLLLSLVPIILLEPFIGGSPMNMRTNLQSKCFADRLELIEGRLPSCKKRG